MDIKQALAQLGVTDDTLSAEEKYKLDTDGYLPLYDVFSSGQVTAFNARLEQLVASEGDRAGLEVHQEAGTNRLSNLVNKGEIFELYYTHPRVLAAIAHVLQGDMKLSSLNYRAALPGEGLQSLHVDWGGAVPADGFEVCNSIWLLDDFNVENGATRVVPGSHQSATTPQQALDDPKAPHPEEVVLSAPAGTVVIFNSHTWHGGTINRTSSPRRAMHSYFTRRHNAQQTDQSAYITDETRARLSQAAKVILDV